MNHPHTPSFVRHVGLQFGTRGDGRAEASLELREEHMNGNGVVHGGALFTLADTAMGSALLTVLERTEMCATIEIKINYFKAVAQGLVQCRAQLLHRGRRTAYIEAELWSGEVLAAKATGTFAIMERKPLPGTST